MDNRGLLFIPDISGFTRFISQTEIEHSRLIIQELLEVLINANNIGLEISEIEGDAILFYKFGDPPELKEIYKQVEKMFCSFHQNLFAYEHRRYCQCTACSSAIDLSLKVITHYGEFTGYNVKNFNKLIGKDIIVAHQLLKNDINNSEYWLVTKSLVKDERPMDLTKWMQWMSSAKKTENGEVPFHYTQLSKLKDELYEEPVSRIELAGKKKVVSVTKDYDAQIIPLFHATGDFNYRSQWMDGVIRVEDVNHFLPRVGMRCKCITTNGVVNTYSSSYFYSPDHIEFSETNEKNKNVTYFTLQKVNENKTRFTLEYFVKNSFPSNFLFNLTQKKKLQERFERSLEKQDPVVKAIKLPG